MQKIYEKYSKEYRNNIEIKFDQNREFIFNNIQSVLLVFKILKINIWTYLSHASMTLY